MSACEFTLNGVPVALECEPRRDLLELLRNELALQGSRRACIAGQCGACHVLVDGQSIAACETPAWWVDGKTVTTIEGLGTPQQPHRLQRAFIAEQAAQCGYCTSGMIIAAAALLEREPRPTEARVREALVRHLCRCGSHNRIVRAVLRAASES